MHSSISTSIALASVITAIATALLATVIFVLVQIAVCKYHPKFTPGGAETGAGGEGQVYEGVTIDGSAGETGHIGAELVYEMIQNGDKANGSDYAFIVAETRKGGEGNTFQLKENEAYATVCMNTYIQ